MIDNVEGKILTPSSRHIFYWCVEKKIKSDGWNPDSWPPTYLGRSSAVYLVVMRTCEPRTPVTCFGLARLSAKVRWEGRTLGKLGGQVGF